MGIFLRHCLRWMAVIGFFVVAAPVQADGGRSTELPLADKQKLVQWSRDWLDGKTVGEIEWPGEFASYDFIVTVFNVHGEIIARKKSSPHKPDENFKDRVISVLREIQAQKTKHFSNTQTSAFGKIKRKAQGVALGNVSAFDDFLHIEWIPFVGKFNNFGLVGLFDNKVFEPGMTGLAYTYKDQTFEFSPLQTIKLNLDARTIRARLAKKIGINPKLMSTVSDLGIQIYAVDHFGESFPDRKFIDYVRGREFVAADDVDAELVEQRLKLIGKWYRHNFINGEVAYEYYPEQDKANDAARTIVRSTMSVWVLNKLAVYLKDQNLMEIGSASIEHYLKDYFRMPESLNAGKVLPREAPLQNGYLVKNHWSSAGFVILAILERGEQQKYQKQIDLLFEWMLTYEKPDHTMWTEEAQNQYFMPGQFLLCVAKLFEVTKDQKYRDVFDRIYFAYEKQLYAMMHLGNDLYTPYAPAWFTQPLAKMYTITRDDRYRDMIFAINDRVVRWYEVNSKHQVYPDYDGILAPKPGFFGNNSVTAAALESLADATFVAKLAKDPERQSLYSEILPHTIAYLMRLQYTTNNLYWVKNKKRTLGGFATDLVNGKIWMDNVWHLTSAFMKVQSGKLLDKADQM